MTDDTKLPPLMLDDLRVSGPNRDEADAFDPSETWWTCCDKIAAGYPAADVAGLLLEMDLSDTSLLWSWWRDECMEVAAHGTGREADCPDMLLIAALNAADVRAWRYPLVTGASVAALRAENAKLRALLGEVRSLPGDDDGRSIAIALPHGLTDRIDAALSGNQAPAAQEPPGPFAS